MANLRSAWNFVGMAPYVRKHKVNFGHVHSGSLVIPFTQWGAAHGLRGGIPVFVAEVLEKGILHCVVLRAVTEQDDSAT